MRTTRKLFSKINPLYKFSTLSTQELPVIDLAKFLSEQSASEINKVTDCIYKYGILIVKDPRVPNNYNEEFLNMFERYYESRSNMSQRKERIPECFPENGFQTGVTPDYIERAKSHFERVAGYTAGNKPVTPQPADKDPKWRYLYRIGERAVSQKESLVDPARVEPKDFPEFKRVADNWGNCMLNCVFSVANMLEIGLSLPEKSFTERLTNGMHVLGPTGSDLGRYGMNTVFAGFHYDISFLTIHGKSKFPGLYVWLRTGEKKKVSIPDGCLLLQAGRELEYLTGGHIEAGYHEVVFDQDTQKSVDKAKKEGRSLWRVSSTLFSHVRGDVLLQPLGKYATKESVEKYRSISGEQYTMKELGEINLFDTGSQKN